MLKRNTKAGDLFPLTLCDVAIRNWFVFAGCPISWHKAAINIAEQSSIEKKSGSLWTILETTGKSFLSIPRGFDSQSKRVSAQHRKHDKTNDTDYQRSKHEPSQGSLQAIFQNWNKKTLDFCDKPSACQTSTPQAQTQQTFCFVQYKYFFLLWSSLPYMAWR